MTKVMREIWGGIVKFEEDDIPYEIRSFNSFGKSLPLWLFQSKSLHSAARKVAGPGPIASPFDMATALMLGGYAIETLLKLVLIFDHCEIHGLTVTATHAVEFVPKGHDLDKLVVRAGLRVNRRDRALLAQLSRYIKWGGRYPIPLTATGYPGPAVIETIKHLGRKSPLWLEYEALYKKLMRLALQKTRPGSD